MKVVLLALLLAASGAPSASIVRGPYLQAPAPHAVTIRWRTGLPAPSVVRWGPSPRALTQSITLTRLRTEHEVRLEGLHPHRRYHYAAGSETGTFVTPPRPGNATAVRAWILGDPGTGSPGAKRVRDAWRSFAGRPPDFWLMLGDNAYEEGRDEQYQAGVFDVYGDELRDSPLFTVFGNHDGISSDAVTGTGPYFDAFTLPSRGESGGVPSGTEAYYAFDWGPLHVVVLDSSESDVTTMAEWLGRDLAATRATWIVACLHHPPYTRGGHDSDREPRHDDVRRVLLPVLEEGGADLVLTGHSHAYERTPPMRGHYGPSSELDPSMVLDCGDGPYVKDDGTIYVVAGSSGKLTAGRFDHPAVSVSILSMGSLVLEADAAHLELSFLDDFGRVRDAFTIAPKKGPGPFFVHR